MKKNANLKSSILQRKATELLKKQASLDAKTSEKDLPKLIHELEAYLIELKMQNEEIRLAKDREELTTRKYTELYDSAPSGYFTLSKKGEILELNITGSQMLGKERSQLRNCLFPLFVSEKSKPTFNNFLKSIFSRKTKETCEVGLTINANPPIQVFLSGILSKNEETCFLTATDITEYKKVEAENSDEQLRIASQPADFGTFSYFFENGKAFYSKEFLSLYNLPADGTIEMDSNMVTKAIHPEDRNRFLVAMQGANNPCGSGIVDIEFRIILKDGSIRWLRSRGLTLFTGNKIIDRPIQTNGIVYDITESKRTEEELAKAKNELEAQNNALSKLNIFSIKSSMLTNEDALEALITKQAKEISGAVFTTFSDFNPINRTSTIKHIEIDTKVTKKSKELLGKKIHKIQSVVTDEMYHEMTTNIIGTRKTLHEISMGSISVQIGSEVQTLLNTDRFIGLAYFIDGELQGTSILGISSNQSDPKKEILKNFVIIASASLQRIKSDKTLTESKEKYYNLHYYASIGIFHSTIDGKFIDMNPALAKLLGYESHEEAVASITNIGEQIYAEPEMRNVIRSVVLNTGREITTVNKYRRRNGELWYGKLHLRLVKDALGKPNFFEGFVEDITESKQSEEQLRKNNKRLELAMQAANMAWWEMEVSTGNVTFNNRKAELLGYPPEKFKHYKDFMALVHPDDYDKTMNSMRNHLNGLTNKYEVEHRILTKSGEYKWFHDIGSIVKKDSNEPLTITGLVIDISNRKKAEEELNKAQSLLRSSIEGQKDTILYSIDTNYQYLYFNKAHKDAIKHAYNKDIKIGINALECITSNEDRKFAKECYDCALNGESHSNIQQYGADELVYYESFLNPILNEQGEIVGVTCLVRNITERIQAEEAVHESYQFNKQIIEGAQEGIVVYDRNLRFQVWNSFMERLTGVSANETLGKKPLDIFPFFEGRHIINNIEKAMKGENTNSIEFHFTIPSTGATVWALEVSSPLYSFNGEIIGVISIIRDITERKQAEADLNESLNLFYTLFNSSPNANALIRISDNKFIEVNQQFLELTGYTIDEIKEKSFNEFGIINYTGLHKTMRTEIHKSDNPKVYEAEIIKKTGELRSALVSIEVISINHEDFILTNLIDYTERKTVETENKEIKESLENLNQHLVEVREKERALIAREIHDQLGQSLTALKIDLMWLRDKNSSNLALNQKLRNMIDLVSETIRDVQRISSDLRPAVLDDIGLSAALEWYCEGFASRTGLQIQMEIDDVQTGNMQVNLTIYRILQESLTNIIRHAKAKNVSIKFNENNKGITLLIQDDGIGIPKEKIKSFKSFGIMGMFERIKQLGGQMEITSQDGVGTNVSIYIPLR